MLPLCTNHGLQVGPEPMAHPPDKVGLQLLVLTFSFMAPIYGAVSLHTMLAILSQMA